MFNQYFETILNGKHLNAAEMENAMDLLMDDKLTSAQIAAFLTALRMNGEDVQEITGAARSMRRHARFIDAGFGEVLDIVGTGEIVQEHLTSPPRLLLSLLVLALKLLNTAIAVFRVNAVLPMYWKRVVLICKLRR